MPQQVHKITMAFPAALHAATATLARANHRSFTGEVCQALDEHLRAAGAETSTATETTSTNATE